MSDANNYYHFFKSEKGFNRISISDKTYPIENKEQITKVIQEILLNRISLDQTNKNELLKELRERSNAI